MYVADETVNFPTILGGVVHPTVPTGSERRTFADTGGRHDIRDGR